MPALALKIGPLGLSLKKAGDDIVKATGDWKVLRVTVTLTTQDRQVQTEVVPSTSALIIKDIKEWPRDRKTLSTVKTALIKSDCQHCPPDAAPIFSQRTLWNH